MNHLHLARGWKIVVVSSGLVAIASEASISPDRLKAHVQCIADVTMRGREGGSPEERTAAHYLARAFQEAGLISPASATLSYLQSFSLPDTILRKRVLPRHEMLDSSRLEVVRGDRVIRATMGKDAIPHLRAKPGEAEGPLWVPSLAPGGTLSAEDMTMAAKAHADMGVAPVALAWIGPEPIRGTIPKIVWATRTAGAAAVVLVVTLPSNVDAAWPWEPDRQAPGTNVIGKKEEIVWGLPVMQVRAAWWRDVVGESVEGVTVRMIIAFTESPLLSQNVVGLLPGMDPILREEWIVVGGHYDHVGLGRVAISKEKGATGQIHPGANDNGAGTACLMEIAQAIGALPQEQRPKRSLLFIGFGSEEYGMYGAKAYLKDPIIPLKQTVGMVNLAEMGRGNGRALILTAKKEQVVQEFLAQREGRPKRPKWVPVIQPLTFSDAGPFESEGVRAYWVTGAASNYPDYHKPSDTSEKIDYTELAHLAMQAQAFILHLANRDR